MTATQRNIFGTATLGDLLWYTENPIHTIGRLRLPNVCAACHDILASERHLREAVSGDGFRRRLPLAELRASAETAGCWMCAVFLVAAVNSMTENEAFAELPVSAFLDEHGELEVHLRLCALLRPGERRRSDRDVHKLLLYGAIFDDGVRAGLPFEFRVYALEGDEASKEYISLAEFDQDLNSEAALSQIRSWMATCDEHHQPCLRLRSGPLPTRVLDVSDPVSLRLCDVNSGDDCQYAALSYCWGGGNQVKTTRSSLEASYLAIDPSSLPLGIQDAVKATRQIGLARLWVDALCIVQDCPTDMDNEIGKMAHVYRNAAVTIMAANASHSGQSFLTPEGPPRRLEIPQTQSCRFWLPMVFPDGAVRDVGVEYPATDLVDSTEPLDQRAWALQESILSRRALVYGTSTLTWRCGEVVEGWNSWVRGHQTFIASNVRLDRGGGEEGLYRGVWRTLVRFYTSRELTFAEDKLPAMSGLASEVRRLSEEKGHDPGRYLAGLWENDLLRQLGWFTSPDRSRDVRGENVLYLAPSWSWASVDCPVVYAGVGLDGPAGTEMEVLDCSTALRSEVLPMGQVLSGRLRARGCLVPGSGVPRPETWLAGSFAGKPSAVVLEMDCYAADDEDAVAKARSCVWLRVLGSLGLVLERVDTVEGSVYKRVGVVMWYNWPVSEVDRVVVEII